MQSVQEYKKLMLLLIRDYRKKWQSPSMPFYWVQLSSIDTTKYQSRYWPMFRDEQRKLLKEVSHGGMAVSSDIGNKTNVHPTNKKDVGERLARWALRDAYHPVSYTHLDVYKRQVVRLFTPGWHGGTNGKRKSF